MKYSQQSHMNGLRHCDLRNKCCRQRCLCQALTSVTTPEAAFSLLPLPLACVFVAPQHVAGVLSHVVTLIQPRCTLAP